MNFLAQKSEGIPIGKTFNSPFGVDKGFGDLVTFLLRSSFVIAGILILFFIAIAGFQIIVGAGQNNPEAAKKGKDAATAAVIGFIVIFVAYWIIRIIELITGSNFITNPVI